MSFSSPIFSRHERLPQDILELIVDALAEDVNEDNSVRLTLGSCLSVSRWLRHLALVRLFRQITISSQVEANREGDAFANLRQILDPPPGLELEEVSRYIKDVKIVWVKDHYDLEEFLSHEDLPFVINKLHHESYGATSFALRGEESFHTDNIAWEELGPELQTALQSLARSPYLRTLVIDAVEFLPVDFLAGSTVTNLSLRQKRNRISTPGLGMDPRYELVLDCPFTVKVLSTDYSIRYVDYKTKFTNLTTLKTVNWKEEQYMSSLAIIRLSAQSLEHLELSLCGTRYCLCIIYLITPYIFLLSIGTATNTESLTFRINIMPHLKTYSRRQIIPIAFGPGSIYEPLRNPNVESIYYFMDFNNELADIYFHFKICGWNVTENTFLFEVDPHWRMLDELFTSSKYTFLQKLTVSLEVRILQVGNFQPIDVEGYENIMKESLRRCFPQMESQKDFVADVKVIDCGQLR